MYIRFRALFIDRDGVEATGIFQAAAHLRNTMLASDKDDEKLHELKDWFNEHLDPPSQFTKRKTGKETGTAISWYKDSATEYITKMFELARILEKYAITITLVKRDNPGYIVYEDDIQVAAIPFKEDVREVL